MMIPPPTEAEVQQGKKNSHVPGRKCPGFNIKGGYLLPSLSEIIYTEGAKVFPPDTSQRPLPLDLRSFSCCYYEEIRKELAMR